LSNNYLLSGTTDIDGEWVDAGFNTGGKTDFSSARAALEA